MCSFGGGGRGGGGGGGGGGDKELGGEGKNQLQARAATSHTKAATKHGGRKAQFTPILPRNQIRRASCRAFPVEGSAASSDVVSVSSKVWTLHDSRSLESGDGKYTKDLGLRNHCFKK